MSTTSGAAGSDYTDYAATERVAASAGAAEPSIGALLGDVGRDLSALVRQEIELAKAEARQSASQAGKGAGLLAAAGLAAWFVLMFLSVVLWWGLGSSIGRTWSALVTAAVWAVVAAVLAVVGRGQLRSVRGLDQTAETVREIPPALKPEGKDNR